MVFRKTHRLHSGLVEIPPSHTHTYRERERKREHNRVHLQLVIYELHMTGWEVWSQLKQG